MGGEALGLLHREQGENLEEVILHDVAYDAVLVEVAGSVFDADVFLPADVDTGDMLGAPHGPEDLVGETQHEQILDHFLAEIVVDAEGLRLGEDSGHLVHEGVGGFAVLAKRFFR